MPKVSIIIRCYNEEAHIGRLLSGIMQQNLKDPDIIVVDSGSTDATLSIASRYPVKIVHIEKQNFSFGYSLNQGCEAATGDYLVIASAHVYPVYHDWINRLIAHFEDDRIGLVYGKQRGNDVTKFSEHQVLTKWFPDESVSNQSHPFCNNANAAIRRSLWEQFRYDETLTGLEDLAWAKQILAAGNRIAYDAEAEIIHVHEETNKQLYNRYRREAIALKAVMPHEQFNFVDFCRMLTTNIISDIHAAHRTGLLASNVRGILSFRWNQFMGTWRGFAQRGLVSTELRSKFYYPHSGREKVAEESGASQKNAIDYTQNVE
jgi:rhamnosyltransferase